MRAYFTTSIWNLEKVRDAVNTIFKSAEENGVIMDKFNFTENSTGNEIHNEQDFIDAYQYIEKTIKKSDFIIADMTYAGPGVGYEIAMALYEKKPCLLLYDGKVIDYLPTPFRGNKTKYLKVRKYMAPKEIETYVKNYVKDIKDLISTKFILILPPEIDRYLEWNTKQMGKSKAEITREALEKQLELSKDYKKYNQDLV